MVGVRSIRLASWGAAALRADRAGGGDEEGDAHVLVVDEEGVGDVAGVLAEGLAVIADDDVDGPVVEARRARRPSRRTPNESSATWRSLR